jgi:hypothetical protein
MPNWDLAVRGDWELVQTDRRSVVYKNGTTPSDNNYKYIPIPPIYATVTSNILLVGTQSNSAAKHWFLGAIASQFLYISPSMSANFVSGVQVGESTKLGLNRLTVVEFKKHGTFDYVLELKIPTWLEDIYIEIWEYHGVIEPDISSILDTLNSIEGKLDAMENYGA